MVGTLYRPGSPLRDAAYNIFYMGINVGAFTAPLVAEVMKQKFGFHPAFVVAGGGMAISLVVFWTFNRHLIDRQDAPQDASLPVRERSALELVPEWKRICALLVIFAIVIVFWMVFHQNGSTLTYWANDNTDWASSKVTPVIIKILTLNMIDGTDVSGVVSNAINPFWIVVLSYPLVRFWGFLNKKGLEPSTPVKMAIGMTLTGCSFLLLYVAAKSGGDTGKVSPWWLIGGYAILSLGELMLSPMGLSLVSKVAPERMRGLLMGGWFVATAIGNKLTMIGVYWTKWPHSQFFLVLASMALFMAVVLVILVRPLKRAMPGV
jgi:POT family proton-dependent oligopeptide transporter